ncbi:fibrillin-1-like [Centruroides sculpturatus]|uniref:fibrillin-1-like n=1 Tax=Centruroides sculpturatus TaxID=218467 RepID=UPI000C6DAFD9|nr:fibrillin-1-like [Centruroides sculpturatus]
MFGFIDKLNKLYIRASCQKYIPCSAHIIIINISYFINLILILYLDINECFRNNGHGPCSDKCTNTKGGYFCSCTIPGTILGPNNHTCEDIDECKENNFGCSHICHNAYGKAFCSCPVGFILDNDDKTCIDYNECEIPEFAQTCKEKCINTVGSFHCQSVEELKEIPDSTPASRCKPGYKLTEIGTCKDINECESDRLNNCKHNCTNTPGSFQCSCLSGYRLLGDGSCEDIDECEDKQLHRCHHYCVNTVGSFNCTCATGFELFKNKSCKDIDECSINNGGCSYSCTNEPGSFHCNCPRGYKLDEDGINCIDIDECSIYKNVCQQRCINTKGSFQCACNEGYKVSESSPYMCTDMDECSEGSHNCSHNCINYLGGYYCTCKNGYRFSENLKSCVDINECESDRLNNCKHNCTNTPGSFQCSCLSGYRLLGDGSCEDIDECEDKQLHRCHHYCVNTVGSFNCTCATGFELFKNKSCKDIDECSINNGGCSYSCTNEPGSFHCNCPRGYKLDEDGINCIDIDECSIYKNVCQQRCINTKGSFQCACNEGYKVSESSPYMCTDMDECSEGSHNCSHNCINYLGGYYCTCKNGYRFSENLKSCVDIDECSEDSRNLCSQICNNYEGGYNCSCESGYQLSSDLNSCLDIDECNVDNGGCSEICSNTPGSFYCSCPDGFKLHDDGSSCNDVDECALNKGGCHQGCINTVGSFQCTCSSGYVLSENNSYVCTDIDECLENTHDCSQNCVNYNGGYYCTCKNGYRLSLDLKSCAEITCPEIPQPHHGRFKCSGSSSKDVKVVNTTCQINCNKGFKARGLKEIKCGLNGKWTGQLPTCESKFCPAVKKPKFGNVSPPSCLDGSSTVSQKCYFICDAGYRLVGHAFLRCDKNLEWKPKTQSVKCVKNELEPFIQCPADISVALEPQQSKHHVKIPEPKSNMDAKHIKVFPTWAEQLEGDFPYGNTEITFIAYHPSKNLTATCRMTVNILDEEAPVVRGCPGTIEVYSESIEPVEVFWKEPTFSDNVRIDSISKTQTPGSKFGVGEHTVHYTARDPAGSLATCIFTVNVLRRECGEPNDILHGEKNCMEFVGGQLCSPVCDAGYAFYFNVSEFYMCGLDGIWLPSKDIPDCLPSISEPEDGCMPGTELREEIDTDSRICVACPPGLYWEIKVSSCIPCPEGFFQDEYGQTACKACTADAESLELCENLAT